MKSVALCLDGELSIYRAAALKELVLAPLGPDTLLELDLAGVTDIDSAGLQLLMLAKQTALAAGGDVRLCAASAPVLDLLALLGLSTAFAAAPAAQGAAQ